MGWFNLVNFVVWSFGFYGVRVTVDFWLRSEVDPSEDNHFFDSLNKMFNYNF
jgi:hypothetical protein